MSVTHLEQEPDLEPATDLMNDEELEAVSGGFAGPPYDNGCIRLPGLPPVFNPFPTSPFRDVFKKHTIG